MHLFPLLPSPLRLSLRASLVACLALAGSSLGCASDADDPGERADGASTSTEDDAALCRRFCEGVDQVCPAAAAQFERTSCVDACLGPDATTAFRRCQADATSCDALAACKGAY